MRLSGLISLLPLLASGASVDTVPKRAGSEVFILGKDTYEKFIADSNVALVEYFAPWCGHCQKLEPEYQKAATMLKDLGIKLAHVNCVEQGDVCAKEEIRGYPTLKVYKNGKATEYGGPRDAQGIFQYMRKQIMPAVSELSLADLDGLKKEEEFLVLGVFPEGSSEAKLFQDLAEEHRFDYTFAKLKAGHNEKDGIKVFKKFDGGGEAKYGGPIDKDAITKWLSVESTPLMAEVSPENYGKYTAAGLPMAYLFYEGQKMRDEYGTIVEAVMKDYKGKINAVYIDAEKYHAHGKALMVSETWPSFVIHEMEADLKYPFTGKINTEELTKFVKEFDSGKLEPSYRSEEIPTKEEGPVTTIVYKNFEKIVMDEKKDVLIELYAPWCGACNRLAPIYDALANTYADHKDKIVIAKMDATANDLPKSAGIKLTKFPTLVLFKAGSKKERVEFDRGVDSVKTLVDFISANAVNKIDIKDIKEPSKEPQEKEEL